MFGRYGRCSREGNIISNSMHWPSFFAKVKQKVIQSGGKMRQQAILPSILNPLICRIFFALEASTFTGNVSIFDTPYRTKVFS